MWISLWLESIKRSPCTDGCSGPSTPPWSQRPGPDWSGPEVHTCGFSANTNQQAHTKQKIQDISRHASEVLSKRVVLTHFKRIILPVFLIGGERSQWGARGGPVHTSPWGPVQNLGAEEGHTTQRQLEPGLVLHEGSDDLFMWSVLLSSRWVTAPRP